MEQEFKALLAGAKLDGKTKSSDKGLNEMPNKEQQRGTIREQRTEKAMSFSSKVKPVRINKP